VSTQFGTDFPAVAFVARTEESVRERIVEAVATQQVDSIEAAAILGVTANNLRQIVHKKQLVQASSRRAMFNRPGRETPQGEGLTRHDISYGWILRVIETEVYEDFPRDPSKVGRILVPSSVITDKQLSDRDFRLSCLE
jgi:hypothetical protein